MLLSREAPRIVFSRLIPANLRGQSFPLIHCLIQDKRGFIWIAGPYGLARYDGNSFLFFQHKEGDPASLSDDLLFNVLEDSRGNIWVTSDKGLDLLDGKKGGFLHFRHRPDDPQSLSSDRIRAICEDATGGLWIGTADGGLNRMDPETRMFSRFLHSPSDPNSPGSDAIWALARGRDGKIWMGATEAGLDCFDPKGGSWTHFPYREGDPESLGDRHYWALIEGRDGRIWIGTNGRGLFELNPATGKFARYVLKDRSSRGSDYRILSLREDRDGLLWVGTDKAGLFRFDPTTRTFDRVTVIPDDPGSLSDNTVMSIIEDREGLLWFGTGRGISILNKNRIRFPVAKPVSAPGQGPADSETLSFYEDRDGILWVGTAKGGIAGWEPKTGTWTRRNLPKGLLEQLVETRIQAVTGDDQGRLWIGTSSGLFRCFPKTGAFDRYRKSALDPSTLPDNDITALLPASSGILWMGTRSKGVLAWDVAAEKVRALPENAAKRLAAIQVNALYRDRRARLWIGTQWAGLFLYDPDSGALSEFGPHPDDPASLPSATVYAVAEDGNGGIWAGTQAGPCLFDDERGVWTRRAETAGLPGHPVQAIVADERGDVWLSSETNLFRIRRPPAVAQIFGPNDGLQGGRFNIGAGLRLRSGEIVFGGAAGFNRFYSSQIVDDPFLPPVAITAVVLSSPPGMIQFLQAPEMLDIPKSRFPATVHLSALGYSHPARNRFRVLVSDGENRVRELGMSRGFGIESLDPGPHRFVFTASNHDGVWNPEGVALILHVTVPFVQTWAGRGLIFALIVFPAGFLVRRQIRLKSRRLLYQMEGDLRPFYEKYDLTKREQEVLGLILQGKSNKEIEAALFISSKTVNNHIYNLYQKIGVRNRLGLVNSVRDFTSRKR